MSNFWGDRRSFLKSAMLFGGAATASGCARALESTASATTELNATTGFINVQTYGAKGDWNGTSGTDDTSAIQAAVNACPIGGTVFFPPGKYKLTGEIRLLRPITILGPGPGAPYGLAGSYVLQSKATANAFTLVASPENYAFGQYGILSVHFRDLMLTGPSSQYAACGVGVDTSVNGGDFHIRECSFVNVNIRGFQTGIELKGIAYLNQWHGGCVSQCATGVRIARGAASDLGGQTRFFGTTFVLNETCVSLNEDTMGGGFEFFGCTLSESHYGVRINQASRLTLLGCDFESNRNSGNGAGIYIPINDSNPNTSAVKYICGNKFITNDADIWIDKTSTAYAGGAFHWPMVIDGNEFQSPTGLKITVPPGHMGINSSAFIFGAANTGRESGALATSQLSTNFFGTFEAKRRITRRYVIPSSWTSGAQLDALPIGMIIQTVRIYLTANASAFTAVQLGNQSNGSAYAFFNGQTQALNTWVTYSSVLGDVVDQTNCNMILGASTGWRGMTAVIEVDGYMP
jgi:hypothetical protein